MNNKTPKETQAVEEELQNIMEDYLMLAEMKSFAKDPVKHMEEMRKHWNILKDFIEQTLKTVEARGHTEGVRSGKIQVLELATKIISNPVEFMQLTVESEITPTNDGA